MTDTTAKLSQAGVSIWLDDLSRERLSTGNLQELIDTKDVVGVTTNPTIFAAALSNGESYAAQVKELAAEGVDVDRVPRVSFIVAGVPAPTVVRRLLDNHMVTSAVGPGHSALLEAMGVMEAGGAVTVGLQPFNTPHDVDQLVRAVASLG